jgi:hypothetical protein
MVMGGGGFKLRRLLHLNKGGALGCVMMDGSSSRKEIPGGQLTSNHWHPATKTSTSTVEIIDTRLAFQHFIPQLATYLDVTTETHGTTSPRLCPASRPDVSSQGKAETHQATPGDYQSLGSSITTPFVTGTSTGAPLLGPFRFGPPVSSFPPDTGQWCCSLLHGVFDQGPQGSVYLTAQLLHARLS